MMNSLGHRIVPLGLILALAGCPANPDGVAPRAQTEEASSAMGAETANAGAAAEAATMRPGGGMGMGAAAGERPARPNAIPAPSDVAAAPANAERTQSGLASRVLEAGTGTDHPGATDVVIAHYTGWTTDGEMFDSSVARGAPSAFPLNRVIAGWTEGLQLMVIGEKRRFWIPEELAYRGRPGAPAGMLVFDVQLLGVESNPPQTPDNVAAAPADAERTESGIASVVLREGYGEAHPTAQSRVNVVYSGWTTDGEMFDTSLRRRGTASFPLGNVIPGWTEGVQLMVEGEKRRFWIPANLAYEGQPSRPQGTLVFDITLLGFR